MSRLKQRFERLGASSRTALVPFVTAGDPVPAVTVPLMHDMVAAGADIIELGVPFSDPMADGPVIQRSSERALENEIGIGDVLEMVRLFRQQDDSTPVILMGYLNPVENMGYEAFAIAAANAGIDGLLTVDIPPEEAQILEKVLEQHDIDPIFLLAPTSTAERIQKICDASRGFVYYVSVKGVTGSSALDTEGVARKVEEIRGYTDLPVGVGFGIKNAETAKRVGRFADAVVVGSAIVSLMEKNQSNPQRINEEVCALLAGMRAALDRD